MSKTLFSTPSLAVAFFASAGGKALLSAALDMRAALANLDEGDDDADAYAAKSSFDDLTDLLSEAGVSVVIAPGGRGDESSEDRARRLGYVVESVPFAVPAFVYVRPNGEADSERFPSEAAAWTAAGDDAALWVMDHGDDADDDEEPAAPPRETVMTDFERDTVANLASVYGVAAVIEAAGGATSPAKAEAIQRVSDAGYRIWPVSGDVNTLEPVAPGLSRAAAPSYVVELPGGGRLSDWFGDFDSAVESAAEHLDAGDA